MFGKLINSVADKVLKETEDFVSNPLGYALKTSVKPINNTLELVKGLTEGELRSKAAISLGADIALGMTASELIEWYNENN